MTTGPAGSESARSSLVGHALHKGGGGRCGDFTQNELFVVNVNVAGLRPRAAMRKMSLESLLRNYYRSNYVSIGW